MNTEELYPLPDSLYDSKDWVASDYSGRVEWLHFMYESKKREVEQLETALLRAALAQPERHPLTEEALMTLLPGAVRLPPGWKDFARAIEKAHGIGGEHE